MHLSKWLQYQEYNKDASWPWIRSCICVIYMCNSPPIYYGHFMSNYISGEPKHRTGRAHRSALLYSELGNQFMTCPSLQKVKHEFKCGTWTHALLYTMDMRIIIWCYKWQGTSDWKQLMIWFALSIGCSLNIIVVQISTTWSIHKRRIWGVLSRLTCLHIGASLWANKKVS